MTFEIITALKNSFLFYLQHNLVVFAIFIRICCFVCVILSLDSVMPQSPIYYMFLLEQLFHLRLGGSHPPSHEVHQSSDPVILKKDCIFTSPSTTTPNFCKIAGQGKRAQADKPCDFSIT